MSLDPDKYIRIKLAREARRRIQAGETLDAVATDMRLDKIKTARTIAHLRLLARNFYAKNPDYSHKQYLAQIDYHRARYIKKAAADASRDDLPAHPLSSTPPTERR